MVGIKVQTLNKAQMKVESTNVQDMQETPAIAKLPVISRYFSCRFFKKQVLHSYILQATDEDDVRKKFKQKYRGRYNLLEISQL